jgi:hypothetical protein
MRCGATGSHWEARLYATELMDAAAGAFDADSIRHSMSPLTLALLQDTGVRMQNVRHERDPAVACALALTLLVHRNFIYEEGLYEARPS